MSLEVAQKSNELDIDDGTMPIEDAAQTEGTEETAQIDDDGDVDGSQVSEAETADDAAPDDAEDKSEDAAEDEDAEDEGEKPESSATPPAADASASEWKQYAEQIREEFGSVAAKPFEAMLAKMERQEKFIQALVDERKQIADRSDRQIAQQHMGAAGIEPSKYDAVYADACEYLEFRKKQGRTVTGMDALKWAIRSAGGDVDAIGAEKPKNTAVAKAAKLQGLRSIPPKSRQSARDLDLDDPAVADGTAPIRSPR